MKKEKKTTRALVMRLHKNLPIFDASYDFWFQHKQYENQKSLGRIDHIGNNEVFAIWRKRPRNRFGQPCNTHYDKQTKK